MTKTDAVKEKLKAKAGEAAAAPVNQSATDSSPPEVKPSDPKSIFPTFDISRHNITTAPGVKAAAAELIAVLGAYPQEERPGVFLGTSGVMVVDAMRSHGMALDVKKLEALGINLPATESAQSEVKAPSFFKGKKEGEAA